ncbi:MAG: GTP-binding protein [Cyanobacteria bacterium P01_A01_bin.37]
MSRTRLLLLAGSVILIVGMTLWFIGTLSQFYAAIATTSTFLANVLLVFVLLLLVALIAGFIYYGILFSRPNRARAKADISLPSEKVDIAEETVAAVRKQVSQIQDEISRQALLERSHRIAHDFKRQHFHVAVFGTGAAGKTSIVNAILGRTVGEIGAPIGTTTIGETYRFRLKHLDDDIWITDTPGISEAAVLGTEREQQSRQIATESDLLIFVIDNDLRQSEYELLKQLVDIGKRSILAFNKIDLYPDEDLKILLAQLKRRVEPFLNHDDVVAIAAHPQPIVQAGGDRYRPQPYLLPLLRRISDILRSEGNDLIADNILLQAQRLSNEARQLIDDQRQQSAEKVVERFQWISGGVVSLTPLPILDFLATAAINAQMVVELGKVYGCNVSLDQARELAISLAKTLVGLGIVKGAVELSTIALQLNLGTLLIGQAIQGVTAAYLTRVAGKSFIEYFRQNQSWGDGGITDVVQNQFQLNRRDAFVKAFMNEAIERIVTPLRN